MTLLQVIQVYTTGTGSSATADWAWQWRKYRRAVRRYRASQS
ncbi:MAG: hypothetical protein ACRDOK_04530 [Streptosporangiaceae bacterium]